MSQNVRPSVIPRNDRLPSLRPPRDVTLVGNQAIASGSVPQIGGAGNRSRFVPNLALAGKRQASNATDTQQTNSDLRKGSRGRGRGAGRGIGDKRRKQEPEIIQSKGIFSDGFNEGAGVKTSSSTNIFNGGDSGGGGGGGSGGSSRNFVGRRNQTESSSGSTSKLKSETLETDEMALSELLKDNFISDLTAGEVCPVVLPLSNSERKSEQHRSTINVKTEANLKHENFTDAAIFKQTFSNDDTFNSDQGSFIFVQLPSVLSSMFATGKDTLDQQDRTKVEIKTEVTSDYEEKPAINTDVNDERKTNRVFDGLPQGILGKLQVLKSGRLRLKLMSDNEDEPVYFDVSLSPTNFAQELVSIQCDNPEFNEGTLNVICDEILHKMFIMPNIDDIISKLKR